MQPVLLIRERVTGSTPDIQPREAFPASGAPFEDEPVVAVKLRQDCDFALGPSGAACTLSASSALSAPAVPTKAFQRCRVYSYHAANCMKSNVERRIRTCNLIVASQRSALPLKLAQLPHSQAIAAPADVSINRTFSSGLGAVGKRFRFAKSFAAVGKLVPRRDTLPLLRTLPSDPFHITLPMSHPMMQATTSKATSRHQASVLAACRIRFINEVIVGMP